MTHLLLLLLLLRDKRRSQVGAMNSTCKDTWAGDVQQMVEQTSLQHDNTVASSAQEHAGGCCRGGQQHKIIIIIMLQQHKMCNVGQERVVGLGSRAWRVHTFHTAACIINTDTSRHHVH
jgi:altronate dehydratase